MKLKCVDCWWEALVGLQKKEKLLYYDKVETVRAGNFKRAEQHSGFCEKTKWFFNYTLTNVKLVTRTAILKLLSAI